MRMPKFHGALAIVGLVGTVGTASRAEPPSVIINGQPLPAAQVDMLEEVHGPLEYDRRYWYDPISGLWGEEGGPNGGQIEPGLELGGALQADASIVHTEVFINGREIHVLELRRIERLLGEFSPGRYWLKANGIGGPEGKPASFVLSTGATAGVVSGNRGPIGRTSIAESDDRRILSLR